MKLNWTVDELILALELYLRDESAIGKKTHPEVIKLSKLLNTLPIHPIELRNNSFRNPAGVAMKLGNFLRFDDRNKGSGLSRGSKLEEEVWNAYSNDYKKILSVKESVVRNQSSTNSFEFLGADEDFALEGRILSQVHHKRERNSQIIKKKKKLVLSQKGALQCEVCSFDFEKFYGDKGNGFAECHHIIPISELSPNNKTHLNDLAILCANCHRMIHRSKPWLSISELKKIIYQSAKRNK